MERLEKDALLKFNPHTLIEVRRRYNLEKPGQMNEAIDVLEDWIAKQTHFTKKVYTREYLERVIIQVKGSVERAKSQLDKICTLRTMIPRYFEMTNPQEELKELKGYVAQALLPKLTEDNYRIFMWRVNAEGPHTTKRIFLMYNFCLRIGDYIKSHDYCDGVILLADMRGVPITEFVSQINLTDVKQMVTIFMEGYDIRIKHMIFISTSNAISILINLLKQFFTPKIASRVHVFKEFEAMYKFVPRDFLPEDYGGKEKTLYELDEVCLAAMSTPKKIKYWEEMKNACTDETKRSKCTFDESIMGLSGTFRSLNVD